MSINELKKLKMEIDCYKEYNEQEKTDKKAMLEFIETNKNYLLRDNKIAHFTASSWVVNHDKTKALMVYHNIYDSWSWTGGHADGEEDLGKVALREVSEETGLKNIKLIDDEIFSIEILPVAPHYKKGEYINSHLHLNVTYLVEADEIEELEICEEENSGVKWFPIQEAIEISKEEHMKVVYRKLVEKMK